MPVPVSRRRAIRAYGALLVSTLVGAVTPLAHATQRGASAVFSKAQWKKHLTAKQFDVLFNEATERAGTSPLNHEKRKGTYVCAACYQPLFESGAKFDSGTGWPSFFKAIKGAVATKRDWKLLIPRTEYHCSYCGGHQGHVFEDGPKPTGLRYCNNGVALDFIPKGETLPKRRG